MRRAALARTQAKEDSQDLEAKEVRVVRVLRVTSGCACDVKEAPKNLEVKEEAQGWQSER